MQAENDKPLTWCFWINPQSYGKSIMEKGRNGSDGAYFDWWFYLTSDGNIQFRYSHSSIGWQNRYQANPTIPLNTWTFISVSYQFGDGQSMKIYFNGIEVEGSWIDHTGNDVPYTSNETLCIGRQYNYTNPNSPSDYFEGKIDDIRIYDQLLTETEIQNLYNESPSAQMVFWEDFEDDELHPLISIETTGSFSSPPGIKNRTEFGSTKAFGFGKSTCGASCFSNYATRFYISFPEPVNIDSLIFKVMELDGDWGSSGYVYIDGQQIDGTYLGHTPSNSHQPDVAPRVIKIFALANVSEIKFNVQDITNSSEIFIDDIQIYGPGGQSGTLMVTPTALNEVHSNPPEITTKTITLTNTGDEPINWEIEMTTQKGARSNAIPVDPEVYQQLLDERMAAEGLDLPGTRNINTTFNLAKTAKTIPSPNQSDNEVIRHDNGVNDDAIGLTNGGTFQVAAYFPASTMGQYTGMQLSQVEVYINDAPSLFVLKIYDVGTTTIPGALLHKQTVSVVPMSWNMIELSEPVDITGDDLWIGYEVTHPDGAYPAGVDAGPAIAGFGDMVSLDGINFYSMYNEYGNSNNFNWNIAAHLTGDPILPDNDVSVQLISSPKNGTGMNDEPVKFTIQNNGTNDQSGIPWEVSWSGAGNGTLSGTYNETILAGNNIEIDAGNTDLSAFGEYTFVACTQLPGDENPDNDCKIKTVTHMESTYCDASTLTEDEYISNVLCGIIDNSSGWQGGVADYTDISTVIEAGASEDIIITNGNAWTSDIVTIWVDWDLSNTFDQGTDEEFFTTNVGGAGQTFTGEISVPSGTPSGEYRMRVRMTYSSAPLPCGSANYGEVEDYTIVVGGGSATDWLSVDPMSGTIGGGDSETITVTFNSEGITAGIYTRDIEILTNDPTNPELIVPATLEVIEDICAPPTNLVLDEVWNTGAIISWTTGSTETSWDVLYGYQDFNTDSEGTLLEGITENPFTLSDLEPATGYDVYLRAVCDGEVSEWSLPLNFTTFATEYTVSGEGSYCQGSIPTGINILLDGSELMVNYQLLQNGEPEGQPVSGTGNPLTWNDLTSGNYTVEALYEGGSNLMNGEAQVIELPLPEVICPEDMIVCADDEPFTLDMATPAGGSYSGQGVENNVFYPASAGVGSHAIQYAYTDNNGCDNSCSFTISIFNPVAIAEITATPDLLCVGETLLLSANVSGGSGNYTYQWTSDPPGFSSSEAQPEVNPTESTTYILKVSDECTTASGEVLIRVFEQPYFAEISAQEITFDTTFAGNTLSSSFMLGNQGCEILEFELDVENPFILVPNSFEIQPDHQQEVMVYFNPTLPGNYQEEVEFTTNATNTGDLQMTLNATARNPYVNLSFNGEPEVSPEMPDANDEITLSFTFGLEGERGFEGIQYRVKNLLTGNAQVFTVGDLIAPGSTYTAEYTIQQQQIPGVKHWEFKLDPNELIEETDELNNTSDISFQVLSLPELEATGLSLSEETLLLGETIHAEVTFRNNGEAYAMNAPYKITATDNFGNIETVKSGQLNIPGNDSIKIEADYIPLYYPGNVSISAIIDPDNNFVETNETNNSSSNTFVAILPSPVVTIGGNNVVNMGEPVVFNVHVLNDGMVGLENIQVDLNKPALLQLVNATPQPSNPDELIWNFNALAPGVSKTIQVVLLYPEGSSGSGSIVSLNTTTDYQYSGLGYSTGQNKSIQLGTDTRLPQLSLSLPSQYFTTGAVEVQLTANEPLEPSPEYFLVSPAGDTILNESYAGSGKNWNATISALASWPEGDYLIRTKAYDLAGNANNASTGFYFDVTQPMLSVNLPEVLGHNSFEFTISTDEMLAAQPEISITSASKEDIVPVLVSTQGLNYKYMCDIPEGLTPENVDVSIQVEDLAELETNFETALPTDYEAPVITHDLPEIITSNLIIVRLTSDEPLISKPTIWITDDAGQSLTFQGPYPDGNNSYKVYIFPDLLAYEGSINFVCKAVDLAGNESWINHQAAFDNKGPEITIVCDPETPSGDFFVRIFVSEPVQQPLDITFYGNEPGEVISAPTPDVNDDFIQFDFSGEHISKIVLTATDTLGFSSNRSKTYCDLEIPDIPFQFSTIPNGQEDCTVTVVVNNKTGVPVENIPVALSNTTSYPFVGIDTIYTSLSAFESKNVSFNWPAEEQDNQQNLMATINPGFVFPETNYNNNGAVFKRLYHTLSINKSSFEKTIDTTALVKFKAYSSMSWDTITPEDITLYAKVFDQQENTMAIDSTGFAFTNPFFNFEFQLNELINSGDYIVVVYFNDNTGLSQMTDTICFYLSEPLSVSVQTDTSQYHRDDMIEISGHVWLNENNPVQSQDVTIQIHSSHGTRVFKAITNETGEYSYTFNPYAQEAGNYEVTAKVDIQGIRKQQTCTFNMYGLYAQPSNYNVKLSRNSNTNGTIGLHNIGSSDLSGLIASVNPPTDPMNIQVVVGDIPYQLSGGSNTVIPVEVISGEGEATQLDFEILLTTDQGEEETVVLHINTAEAVPNVVPLLANYESILQPGESRTLTLSFVNKGFEEAENPMLELPDIPFIQQINPPSPGNINVDDTISFQIAITPDTLVDEDLYAGLAKLNFDNQNPVETGVSIFITDNSKGNLLLTTNSSVYNTIGNTSVHIYSQKYDPYTHSYPVFSGISDEDGNIYFDSIPSGTYHYQAQAEKHSDLTGSIFINPTIEAKYGKNTYQQDTIVLNYNPIQYNWTVEETTIEDNYQIQLEAIIEPIELPGQDPITPPAPTVEPSIISHVFGFNEFQNGTFRIVNYGDIELYDIQPTESTVELGDGKYRLEYINWEDILTLGLGKNQSGTVGYYVQKLFTDHSENSVYGRLHFTGKYMLNGIEQPPIQFSVFVHIWNNTSCLEISPGILSHSIVNDEVTYSTTSISLTNTDQYGTTEFYGGSGYFAYELTEWNVMISILTGGLGTWGHVIDALLIGNEVSTLAGRINSNDPDVTIDPISIPMNETISVDVDWHTFPDTYFQLGVGMLFYGSQCSDGEDDYGRILLGQTKVTTGNSGIGEPVAFQYIVPAIGVVAQGFAEMFGMEQAVAHISEMIPPPGEPTTMEEIHMTIDQELTLERQAFNVQLNLSNDTELPITDFAMNVITKDDYGNIITTDQYNDDCPFFFTPADLTGISAIDGTGVINPGNDATIHWLVIPKVGAGGEEGTGYQFQGNFSFSFADTTVQIETANASLTVQPMPVLNVTYSTPEYFYEDQEFLMTVQIENNGYGAANEVQLTTGQPALECFNQYNNPVSCDGFSVSILGGFLGNQYQTNNMTIDFQDIIPSDSKVGYWEMLADFNGKVTSFTANFEHSSELGGQSTSLINSVTTANILWFLKIPNFNTKSEFSTFVVTDSTFNHIPDYLLETANGIKHPLQILNEVISHQATFEEPYLGVDLNNSQGWGYFSTSHPFAGSKDISWVSNSTGYILDPSQYWIDSTFKIHVVDNMVANASYQISFADPSEADLALFEELLTLTPEFPLSGDPVDFSIEVYNGSDMLSESTNLKLFRNEAGKNMTEVGEYPVEAIASGETQIIQDVISIEYLVDSVNHFRFILDSDSLTQDINRANNRLDFEIIVTEPGGCEPPTALSVSEITSESADIGWNSQSGNQWDILFGEVGFDVQTGGTLVESVNQNPYTINGLIPANSYDVYVRTNCVDEVSAWSGPATFSTLPSVFEVSGGGSYCEVEEPTNINVTLNGSEQNVWYMLYRDDGIFGEPLQGDGAGIEWLNLQQGVYTIMATYSGNNVWMNGEAVIIENPLPEVICPDDIMTCVDAGLIELTGALPEGGQYEGTAVSAGYFDPDLAGLGIFEIQYTYTDPLGCSNSCLFTIEVNDVLEVLITPDGPTSFCDGESVTLTATQGTSYLWSTGETSQIINVGEAGTYTVEVTDENGCTGIAEIETTVYPLPEVEIYGQSEICEGESIELTATESESYLWNTGETTQSILVSEAGEYSVEVTDESGCTGFAQTEIIINPLPVIEISGDTEICEGELTELTATGHESYLWSTGETTQSIVVSEAGVYSVEVTDENGCTGIAQVEITVNPLPLVEITGDIDICEGESTELTATDGVSYLWNTGETTQSIFVSEAGDYSVEVTDENGCTGSGQIEVTVYPLPFVEILGDTEFCEGGSTELTASEGISYLWNTGETTQSITVIEAGDYSVEVTDENGCIGIVQVEVNTIQLPTLSCPEQIQLSIEDPVLVLEMSTPAGGVYSGVGVSFDDSEYIFNPAIGTGVYEITYCYVDPETGCENCCLFNIAVSGTEQEICIPEGWSLISSYYQPDEPAIEVIFEALVADNSLAFMLGDAGIFWPGQNINTLGDWDVYEAYKVKMNDPGCTVITGDMPENKSVVLKPGINLLPVLCEQPLDANELLGQLGNRLTYAFDIYNQLTYIVGKTKSPFRFAGFLQTKFVVHSFFKLIF